ncbi:hypothetical protein BDZ94DRAFT_1259798 [Collybia nuda]|uniref:Uncharacterized protein n=1 Tax=Collybia nuda TaxID=64659 RepID=A0A9P5Y5C1_9AGAR|nr:hypothetical protein BDZ94DRAFT_1259798 [Collybia nuda]
MDWLCIQNNVCDMLAGVHIDWELDWKGQQNRKLVKLFDAVEEAEPSLCHFQNQWAVEYLAKEVFTTTRHIPHAGTI